MRFLAAILVLAGVASAEVPTFKPEQIDASLKIGYAVLLVDINADQKPDIVVCDKDRVIWFENPTWKLRVITEGKTKLDNVCIDAADIDGDGTLDLALGAGWQPGNTKDASTLQWLRRGKTLDEPWEMFPIKYEEPTLHRMRFVQLGQGKPLLLTVPLTGRGATKEKNWSEAGVKIQVHRIADDPTSPDWPMSLVTQASYVAHNFHVTERRPDGTYAFLVASYGGVHVIVVQPSAPVQGDVVSKGDQSNPAGSRGASEVKSGHLKRAGLIATIEPWHGDKVVAYTRPEGINSWGRTVIDDQLRWGHAVWCADLDGDAVDEIIVGVRDPLPDKAESGVRVYRAKDDAGTAWSKTELEPGGVAVEDLAVADLNADGKPDIVAVGRQTKNVKIYWNSSSLSPRGRGPG